MKPRRLDEFLSWKPEPLESLVSDGLFYKNNKLMIYGKYKSFKSMLAKHLGLCLAAGNPWLGFGTAKSGLTVMYLQLELPEQLLQDRMLTLCNGTGKRTQEHFYVWSEPFLKLDRPEGVAHLEQHVSAVQPDVLIIDPVYKIMSNVLDVHSAQLLTDAMDQLIAKHNLSVILIHHTRKDKLDEGDAPIPLGSDDMYGPVVFSWWADAILRVTRKGGSKDNRELIRVNFDIVRHAKVELTPKEVIIDKRDLSFTVVDAGSVVV